MLAAATPLPLATLLEFDSPSWLAMTAHTFRLMDLASPAHDVASARHRRFKVASFESLPAPFKERRHVSLRLSGGPVLRWSASDVPGAPDRRGRGLSAPQCMMAAADMPGEVVLLAAGMPCLAASRIRGRSQPADWTPTILKAAGIKNLALLIAAPRPQGFCRGSATWRRRGVPLAGTPAALSVSADAALKAALSQLTWASKPAESGAPHRGCGAGPACRTRPLRSPSILPITVI